MSEDKIKQILIVRRDLKMRKGKEIAQLSHASLAFLSAAIRKYLKDDNKAFFPSETPAFVNYLTDEQLSWLEDSFTKVVLQVETELDLLLIHKQALEAGLESNLITDKGLTEFHNIPTITALGIGPHLSSKIDPLTSHLKLY